MADAKQYIFFKAALLAALFFLFASAESAAEPGRRVFPNGDVYEGETVVRRNTIMPHGRGRLIFHDNTVYKGSFRYGKKHGYGIITTPEGDTYKGNWKNDLEHGYGELFFKNGDIYKGQWRSGKQHGEGIFLWKSGKKYEGSWKNGEISGYGVLTDTGGTVSKGIWKNGRLNGKGTVIWSYGKKYEGSLVNHLPHGQGSLTYQDGSVFQGSFHKGKKHGKGKVIKDAKVMVSGEWRFGKMIEGNLKNLDNDNGFAGVKLGSSLSENEDMELFSYNTLTGLAECYKKNEIPGFGAYSVKEIKYTFYVPLEYSKSKHWKYHAILKDIIVETSPGTDKRILDYFIQKYGLPYSDSRFTEKYYWISEKVDFMILKKSDNSYRLYFTDRQIHKMEVEEMTERTRVEP